MDHEARLALARLAADQRGLFSADQASQVGIGYGQLSRATRSGYLRRTRPGVYAIAGTPPSRWENILSAALSAGPGAVISHLSAAAVHRLHCGPGSAGSTLVELTLTTHRGCRLEGVKLHRTTFLPPGDTVQRNGVMVTAPARTLVDMAGRLGRPILEQTLDEGLLTGKWTVDQVAACMAGLPTNLAGRARLDRLLSLRAETPAADSALEARVYRVLSALTPFEAHFVVNVGQETFVIDAAWPERRVGAEIVGRAHRVASRSAFDRERRKLNVLAAAGWRLAHLTATMSADDILTAVIALLDDAVRQDRPSSPRAAG